MLKYIVVLEFIRVGIPEYISWMSEAILIHILHMYAWTLVSPRRMEALTSPNAQFAGKHSKHRRSDLSQEILMLLEVACHTYLKN